LETIASYDAVDEGTYFVTVIAMNPANDASQAVCSVWAHKLFSTLPVFIDVSVPTLCPSQESERSCIQGYKQ
jgi:hypothetical protein